MLWQGGFSGGEDAPEVTAQDGVSPQLWAEPGGILTVPLSAVRAEELHSIKGELSQIKAQVDSLLESLDRMDQRRERLAGDGMGTKGPCEDRADVCTDTPHFCCLCPCRVQGEREEKGRDWGRVPILSRRGVTGAPGERGDRS